jgi:hypothetical protein
MPGRAAGNRSYKWPLPRCAGRIQTWDSFYAPFPGSGQALEKVATITT